MCPLLKITHIHMLKFNFFVEFEVLVFFFFQNFISKLQL